MARLHGQAKVINYRLIKERSQTISFIIDAFEKSVNFHFKKCGGVGGGT